MFQRKITQFISEEKLKDTVAYLDNVTVAGRNQLEHDDNVKAFLDAINRRNFTLNETKTVKSVFNINILGFVSGSQTFCDATHLKKFARLCDAPDSIPRFSLPYCEITVTHNVQITVLMKPRFWIGLSSSIVKLRSSKFVTQLVIFHVFVKHTTECFILNIFFAN